MLKTQPTKKAVKVTFEVEQPEAELVEVLGEWNDWTPVAMKKFKNGKHKTTVDLHGAQAYQFLYRVNSGETWLQDEEAERVPNGHGGYNSLVRC